VRAGVVTAAAADTDSDGELSEEELSALTVAQLRAIAAEKGITLTKTKKAEIIAEILAALAADAEAEAGT
jgi:hypothetical protein